ncbi:transmembrane and TPR repeat-containing protein CG4050-like [Ctenocephalides felis]|uniref:transmembrane and TPR repeat-containing protein CG4050-like n=1 Tax=Ctenocephalides felis TaxID=7515 RepID=UPI000E6E1AF1|nr:transmembrane and TPR repeat-containing protein CG4050-like [Ctenocephalides felis]
MYLPYHLSQLAPILIPTIRMVAGELVNVRIQCLATNVPKQGLAFMALPFLPASNLFFPVGFVVAERVLYMPSMGFCMLVGYGWYLLPGRKLAWWLLAATLAAHAIRTHRRNWDWESEYSIFMAGLKVNQNNAKLFNNVGHALESQGRYVEALHYFHTAVSVQPDDVGAHINVGRTYNHLKKFTEAEEAYLRAKELLPKAKPGESYQARIPPNHLSVFLNLANLIAKNTTRLEEADLLYRQAISMRADYTQAYINRGDVLIRLNRTLEAQEVYERALLYDSSNPDIYYNLGVVFLEQGKAPQALAYLDKALEFDPDHEQALLNSAILLQELGKKEFRPIARERLLKLHAKDENNERVHFNLGMLSMDERNIADAENWFRRAVHIKSDFRSALFNLALLLADDHRPLEAAPFLNQLVRHHPDHAKGLILLGDIYINNIRDLDAAESCYKRILQLDPVNIQGLHNLCVVYVERGKLMQAQSCLKHAHRMAPKEDYILRHLQIVQNKIVKLRTTPEKIENMEAFMEVDIREFGGDRFIPVKPEMNIRATPTAKASKVVKDSKPTQGSKSFSGSKQAHQKSANSKSRNTKESKNSKNASDQQKLKRTDRPRPEPEPMFVDSLDGTVVDATSLRHNTEYRSSNSVHSGITRSAAYSLNPQRAAASDIEEQSAGLS